MLINGTQIFSDVTVNVGATLGGVGTLGAVTAEGSVSPGGPSPGVLQSGNAAFTAGSSFAVTINGTKAGTDYDQFDVGGAVDLTGGPALDITIGFSSLGGDTFTIIASTGSVTGTFAGLPDGATFTINGLTLEINCLPSSVVLTNIAPPLPPPSGPPGVGWEFGPVALESFVEHSSSSGDHEGVTLLVGSQGQLELVQKAYLPHGARSAEYLDFKIPAASIRVPGLEDVRPEFGSL
jgi:hypothetical protein